jgi:kynurenine formamidase
LGESNGQLLAHSNHVGTHLDGEIHFSAGKDIASLDLNGFLVGPGAIVGLSDATGDYQIYTAEMIEERVEVRLGDILVIHTGYHHFGWDMPHSDEIRYMGHTRGRIANSRCGPMRRRSSGWASTAAAPTTQ